MILQVELFWLCSALVERLQPQSFNPKQLELLARRHSLLVSRLSKIATDMYYRSQIQYKNIQGKSFFEANLIMQQKEYSSYLLNLVAALKLLDDRALLLAYAQNDPDLEVKCLQLSQDLVELVHNMEFLGWITPLGFMLAVDSRGRIVNSPNEGEWQLYPEMALGCNDMVTTDWTNSLAGGSTVESKCHYVNTLEFFSRLNTPNYLLWACILPVTEDAEERLDIIHNIIASLVAVVTDDDLDGEDNSPFPNGDQWRRIAKQLPPTMKVPNMPKKLHESFHDVLASKEATANLQLWLMQLLY